MYDVLGEAIAIQQGDSAERWLQRGKRSRPIRLLHLPRR